MFQPVDNPSDNAVEFARRRLQLGENLYYKMLEKILVSEMQRISVTVNPKTVDLSVGSVVNRFRCFFTLFWVFF